MRFLPPIRVALLLLIALLGIGCPSCSPPHQSYPEPLDAVVGYYAKELVNEGRQKWRLFIELRGEELRNTVFPEREVFGVRCLPAERNVEDPTLPRIPTPYEQALLVIIRPLKPAVSSRSTFEVSKLYGPKAGGRERVELKEDADGWMVSQVSRKSVF